MTRPVVGIIAEYNPFHNGHAYHISHIRREIPDAFVLCVMSGNMVQRGELGICRKQARAAMALRGGVDLVLELPSQNACASAEGFARAGVALLAATGLVTHISFGSESGCLGTLERAAQLLDEPLVTQRQTAAMKLGMPYAAARYRALESIDRQCAAALLRPNDLLGVEYLRALSHGGCGIKPLPVTRGGAAHDSHLVAGSIASASFVRARWHERGDAIKYVPRNTQRIWQEELAIGRAPVSISRCETAVLATLRRMGPDSFSKIHDVSEGLEHRLARAAGRASTLEEFFALVKTKRYTHARIRRIALRAYMDLEGPPGIPPYLRVLGATQSGISILGNMKNTAALPILTKPAAAKGLGAVALACFEHEALITDMYALCYPHDKWRSGGQEWRESPVIVEAVEFKSPF